MVDVSQPVAIILAVVGAAIAGWAAGTRPVVAIGCLVILASSSGLVIETPVGTLRPEQPAILVTAGVLLVRGRLGILASLSRWELLTAAAFAVYLGVLALSSAMVAPQPVDSLRMVLWLAISMLGGAVVYVLARPDPGMTILPLAIGGAAKGAAGVLVAAVFLVFGPGADWGIQGAQSVLPRVQAFSWETNLYASFLAMSIPFALEEARGRSRVGMAMLAFVVIGLPLGATRGAYLAAIAGIAAYVVVRLILERRPADLPRLGLVAVASLVVGLIAADVLLPNALERYLADVRPPPTPSGPIAGSPGPAGPAGSAGTLPSEGNVIPPPPSFQPYPDTITFRLDRVPVALDDLRSSPLIGLGAESFGQRHADPSQEGFPPDHLAILAVASLYDAGIIGSAALALGFLMLIAGLWRGGRSASRTGDPRASGLAAAFIGSIVAMVVAFQATNALHFGSNWLVVGAAVAVIGGHRLKAA